MRKCYFNRIEKRKLNNNENNKFVCDYMDNHGSFVDSDGKAVSQEAMIFYANDSEGKKHFFTIYEFISKENMVTYIASEVYEKDTVPVTCHEFEVYGSIEKQEELILELLLKTVKGINHTTLDFDYGIPSVKSTGQMKIIHSENIDGEYGFKINGGDCSPEEAMKLFRPYEGWRVFFQISDCFNDGLEKDALLMPIVINENTFADELKELIMIFSDNIGENSLVTRI